MAKANKEIWFATYRSAGFFVRQVPIHWKGWVIQLGALALFFVIEVGSMNFSAKEYRLPGMIAGLVVFLGVLYGAGRGHSEKRY